MAMMATGGLYGAVVPAGIFLGLWLRGRAEVRFSQPPLRAEARHPSRVTTG
jgi:hypothetical protein